MVYLTGDTHRHFSRIRELCRYAKTHTDDVAVILGDAGINYIGEAEDAPLKKKLSGLPLTLFCIHGNHESRPQHLPHIQEKDFMGGKALYEPAYPNILYAIDGQVYDFEGHKCLAAGGAYSVDKFYRIETGKRWFMDEQPSDTQKADILATVAERGKEIDTVLSHTCPERFIPVEMFLPGIDQSTVDRSTEEFLDRVYTLLPNLKQWYCGHWHVDKRDGVVRFMFNDVVPLL